MRKIGSLLLLIGSFLTVVNSFAAGKEKKIRRQEISFEDELVEGGTQRPELFYLLQKRNFNYGKLIKLRENFIPEMEQSAQGLSRLRRKN